MLNAVISQFAEALPTLARHDARREREGQVRRASMRRAHSHVVDQELFRDAVVRETKRANRFDQPFVLALVEARSESGALASSTWAHVVDALTATKRDTDVLGWFERGAVLGLIVPEIHQADVAAASEFQARIRRELASRLDAGTLSRLSIRLHVHHTPSPARREGSRPVDALSMNLHAFSRGTKVQNALKRLLDIAGSASLLLLIAPLFALIAALVKLKSAGPVFFRQVRVGSSGQTFTMLKFRTMHVHADSAIHQKYVSDFIKAGSAAAKSNGEAVFKITNDPRVTAVGAILRKTSLDELPQLWNVLRGDMSLVGPRPALPYEVEQYKTWHYRRVLEAKPGITGLWQVTGRSRTTFDEMVRLDLRYARKPSVWNDIKILLATPRAVISGKGAC